MLTLSLLMTLHENVILFQASDLLYKVLIVFLHLKEHSLLEELHHSIDPMKIIS